MSVIVKGVEMPKEGTVIAIYKLNGKFYASLRGTELCPIVPLPEKHGRLIDADALIGTIRPVVEEDDYAGCTFRTVKELMTEHIDNAPTVVEAEGE